MGKRSAGETLANILMAFLVERTFTQAALARRCGIGVKPLRKRLFELCEAGVPLESEDEFPHVYWSVPRNWYPNGRFLKSEDVALIARLLGRLTKSNDRTRALRAILDPVKVTDSDPPTDEAQTKLLTTLEDATEKRQAVRMVYYAASRGDRDAREVSIHRILYGPRVRLLATCHRDNRLKYFRLEQIDRATAQSDHYRAIAPEAIEEFLQGSIDGYRGVGARIACTFYVRSPDARWVKHNLPDANITAEPLGDGIRFSARTAGLDPLARFVVGLGAAARAETPELRARVQELALGVIEQLKPCGE